MRLTAAKNPTDQFRNVKEADKWLDEVETKIKGLVRPANTLLQQLASVTTAAPSSFNITERGRKLNVKVKESFTPVPKKTLTDIGKQFAALDSLLEQKEALDEFLLRVNGKFRGQTGVTQLVAKAKKLQSTLQADIGKMQTLLSKLSDHQQPAVFKSAVSKFEKYLPNTLKYTKATRRAYVTQGAKGEPLFWTYLELTNVEGSQSYAAYQIVLSYSPLSKDTRMTTLRQFEMPGRFPRGRAVSTDVKSWLRELDSALTIDGISNEVRKALPEDTIQRAAAIAHRAIQKSWVKDDFIYIKLKGKLDLTTLTSLVAGALHLPSKQSLNISPAKFSGGGTGYKIAVIDPSHRVDVSKLADLKEALELDDKDVNALRQLLKSR